MKAFLLYTANGPLAILTTYQAATAPGLLAKLHGKGIDKFMAWELSLPRVQERYGGHYFVVERDLREDDDLRILDYRGERIFRLFRFDELGPPVVHEGDDTSEQR